MAEVGTGNSVDVNFRVQQTSFDAKGEAGANINTQTADAHDNLDPSLTLALFSEKHPEMCPIFTVTTENFQALQAAQNDGIFISPTTLTLAQGLHESYVQIKNPSDRVLLSDFVTALGFPEFAYEIIVQCRINYEELTSWDRERQNVITVQGTVNEITSADKQVKEAKDDDNQKESLSLCQDIITKLVGVLLNFSDLHDQFCVACSNVGMVQIFVEMTKELKDAIFHNVKFVNPQTQHIKNFTVRGRMLSRILGVLHNLSKRVPTRVNFAACQALDTLIPLLKAEVALFGAKCLLILAYLIDESNNHMIMADEGPIKLLTNLLKMSLSYSNHRCIGFSSSELAEGLTQIAVNDNNKKMIAKCGAIQILVRMLQTAKENEEKLNACNAFWTLAFDEENQMEIKANEQAISELEKLLTDENIEIQRAAAGALWECNGKERYAEEKKQKVGLQQITDAKHVMISYQWDVQKLVVQIKNKLEAGGFKVWMDIDEMGGSTLESMAKAVENASVVLVCVSQKYKESPNCRSEAEYTYQLRKDVIPLMVDGKYRPDGWLGFIVGSKFWIDFSEKHKLDSNVTKLVKELGTRGKIEVVESIVQAAVEDVVDASPHPSIRSWTCSDVKTWLKAIGLENRLDSKALQRLDGRRLQRLHDLRKESPEFFYSSIKTDLKLGNVFDVLDFVDELENLME